MGRTNAIRAAERLARTPLTNGNAAELLIDGKPAGKASRRLRLPTRAHALTVRKQGFMPEHLWVMPKAGSAQRFNITLTTTENRRATARR